MVGHFSALRGRGGGSKDGRAVDRAGHARSGIFEIFLRGGGVIANNHTRREKTQGGTLMF